MKILLDTDIGGDIDDALALAYLLKQPRCELLGITTVGGEAEKRAMLASALCHSIDRAEVPIHAGASAPLLVPERQLYAYQSEVLSDQWAHQPFYHHSKGTHNYTNSGGLDDKLSSRKIANLHLHS